MSLIGKLKEKLLQAVKGGDEPAKNVLRVLLSKVQQNNKYDDESVIAAARSLIKQDTEEISTRQGNVTIDGTIKKVEVSNQEADIERLGKEIETLKQFLPNYLSEETVKAILLTKMDELKATKDAGAATGVAMRILKNHGPVEGGTVKKIVGELWQTSSS